LTTKQIYSILIISTNKPTVKIRLPVRRMVGHKTNNIIIFQIFLGLFYVRYTTYIYNS